MTLKLAVIEQNVFDMLPLLETDAELERVRQAIRKTIAECGLVIAADGEVYSPVPKPVVTFPNQQNVRYSGSRRRR